VITRIFITRVVMMCGFVLLSDGPNSYLSVYFVVEKLESNNTPYIDVSGVSPSPDK
jgi:hypothetical protein